MLLGKLSTEALEKKFKTVHTNSTQLEVALSCIELCRWYLESLVVRATSWSSKYQSKAVGLGCPVTKQTNRSRSPAGIMRLRLYAGTADDRRLSPGAVSVKQQYFPHPWSQSLYTMVITSTWYIFVGRHRWFNHNHDQCSAPTTTLQLQFKLYSNYTV